MTDEKKSESNDVKCIDIKGESEEIAKSHVNKEEGDLIIKILNHINDNRNMNPNIKTIGVITGYREQQNYIKRHLNKKIKGLEIGTFDRFQGREYDLVIASMVRTDKLGFMKDIRRMNVAFSREKDKLIIIGNFDKLKEISQKYINESNMYNEISNIKTKEETYVCRYLIPQIYNISNRYVSDEERINDIQNFLKENIYE